MQAADSKYKLSKHSNYKTTSERRGRQYFWRDNFKEEQEKGNKYWKKCKQEHHNMLLNQQMWSFFNW